MVAWDRGEDRKKKLTTFTYDTSRCMFCGLCEDACPVDALELTQDFEIAHFKRSHYSAAVRVPPAPKRRSI